MSCATKNIMLCGIQYVVVSPLERIIEVELCELYLYQHFSSDDHSLDE